MDETEFAGLMGITNGLLQTRTTLGLMAVLLLELHGATGMQDETRARALRQLEGFILEVEQEVRVVENASNN